MAQYEDLEVSAGASGRWKLKMLDEDGSVRDLSDYTVTAVANRSWSALTDSDQVSFLANIDAPPEKGIINISLNPSQTSALDRRRYVYEVTLSYTDSDFDTTVVERVLEGNLMVSRNR